MFALENYIKQCSHSQAAIFGYLREMILSCSNDIEEEITDNTPTYTLGSKVFSVNNQSVGTMLTFHDEDTTSPQPLHFKSHKEMNIEEVFSIIKKAIHN